MLIAGFILHITVRSFYIVYNLLLMYVTNAYTHK